MIRTLLIDNADSFTFNLFHLLAEVNGCEPVVVPNDWAEYSLSALDDFDNVVISPGPGTPVEPVDFGICADVIEQAEIPVLGVCLGHQGIAYVHGGTIAHAPEPRHGRVSEIRHLGAGLFEGLPSPFTAARYHSLAVSEMPPSLEVTAWSDDGVIMGLAHRTRPQWGVQFHPESIATECATNLLRNFRQMTEEWQVRVVRATSSSITDSEAAEGPMRANVTCEKSAAGILRASATGNSGVATTGTPADRFLRNEAVIGDRAVAAPSTCRELTLHVRELPQRGSALSVFDTLYGNQSEAVWLDGNMPGHPDSRFSIMGAPTGPLSRVVTADVPAGTLEVRSTGGTDTIESEFFDWLNADLGSTRLHYSDAADEADLPFAFRLGWVGYLGYELKAEVGSPNKHESDQPDALLMFLDRALVIDNETSTIYLLALSGDGVYGRDCEAWFDEVADVIGTPSLDDESAAAMRSADEHADVEMLSASPPGHEQRSVAEEGFAGIPGLSARHSKAEYLELIAEAQRLINDGETYEVCLTNMLEMPWAQDALETYEDLRRDNPTPFGAFLRSSEVSVLSTSPERFLQISSSGVAESKPIKGTRPRGSTPEEDDALKQNLQASVKDRSENLMIVDLVRHDLGITAELGTVDVPKLFDVETYATVHQLVSTVRSQVGRGATPVECVRAAFPPGSMTGAPKHRTMSIIDDLERGPRGVYSGAIGYFSSNGASDLSVLIRSAVITEKRISYGVGGAIVALSDSDEEYKECLVKSESFRRIIARYCSPVN